MRTDKVQLKTSPSLGITSLSAVLFCALIFLFYPYRTTFQFDTDEGVNLAKARLVENGYPLYRQVWSDQPPLFTLALASVFPLVTEDLNTARHLVLAFAGLLVACQAYLVQKIWSPRCASWSVVLLSLLVPFFPQLSVSIMIGLPAISLAFLSLAALAAWHTRPHPAWLLLSGAALGLSVMTKLFTGFLAPIFLIGIAVASAWDASRERLALRAAVKPLLVWSAAFFAVFAAICLLVIQPAYLLDLILPHVKAGLTHYYQGYQEEFSRAGLLSGSLPIFGLAALGAWDALRRRRWLALYPLAWMAGGLVFIVFVSPAWYHHTLLVTLPACVLAAGGLSLGLSNLAGFFVHRRFPRHAAFNAVLALGLLAALLWQRLPPLWEEFDHQPYFITLRTAQPAREQIILEELSPYRGRAKWMFTDLPMFAFRSDILLLPELAALTSKRMASGELPQAEIARLVQAYRPEVILIGRFEFPGLSDLLSAEYVLLSSHLDTHIYLRADLRDQG